MIKNLIKDFKEDYLEFIKENYYNDESLIPFITIVGSEIKSNSPSIIHVPIPPEMLKSKEKEQQFISTVLPKVFSHIKEQFIPEMVVFCSYADIKNENLSLDDVLYICYETKDENSSDIFEIIENDMEISENGELKKEIKLEEVKYEGKINFINNDYQNLFKIFETKVEFNDDNEIDL